ncbi:MAG: hypothetical protein LQ347_004704 [Umbilicaria vellea]|nr:MAG: hypothetical protein LQ347_004704 [Umbilicaria vellea]
MRSTIQSSRPRPRLVRCSVVHGNKPSYESIVPPWTAFTRAEHAVATPPAPQKLDRRTKDGRERTRSVALKERPVFFRDACSCPKCVDKTTSQKLFETVDIPLNIEVQSKETTQGDDISVTWRNDIPGYEHHTSIYSKSSFTKWGTLEGRLRASHSVMFQKPWDRTTIESKNLTLDYDSYMNSPSTLHKALDHLHKYGLFFLAAVPSDTTSISTIGTRIGPLQNTFYGSTWDVRSVPSAKNVAYTSSHLGFHMDLLYMADPPKVQILHCMKASTDGGESLFSDALAATFVLLKDPVANEELRLSSLFSFPVTYRYKNDGHWYQYTRPMLETSHNSYRNKYLPDHRRITAINWSPPFQAPFEVFTDQLSLTKFIRAAKQFKALVEDNAAVFETRMDEGTCVVFDNRRILHARRAFSSEGGERWLRGAYVGGDDFMSRLRMLNEEYGVLQAAEDKVEASV